MGGGMQEKAEDNMIVEVRKWEDLSIDCLVKIFEKAEMGSLVFDIPLVCKSWYKASLQPDCWKNLDFPFAMDRMAKDFDVQEYGLNDTYLPKGYVCNDFLPNIEWVKHAVERSRGNATRVVVGRHFEEDYLFKEEHFEEIMCHISEGCPALRSLILPKQPIYSSKIMKCIPSLINKWKDLEHLAMSSNYYFKEILTEIHTHCRSFFSLSLDNKIISLEETLAITSLIPNIKHLEISRSYIQQKNFVHILSTCKDLEFVDAEYCVGFDTCDAEILRMGSHIKKFMIHGSRLSHPQDYDDCEYNDCDLFQGFLATRTVWDSDFWELC